MNEASMATRNPAATLSTGCRPNRVLSTPTVYAPNAKKIGCEMLISPPNPMMRLKPDARMMYKPTSTSNEATYSMNDSRRVIVACRGGLGNRFYTRHAHPAWKEQD